MRTLSTPRALGRSGAAVTCAALALALAGCARDADGTSSSSTTAAMPPTTTPTGVTSSSSSGPVVTETATATATASVPSTSTSTTSAPATTSPSATTPGGATSTPSATMRSSTTAATQGTGAPGPVSAKGFGSYALGASQASVTSRARAEGYALSTVGPCTIAKKSGVALVMIDGTLSAVSVDGPAKTDRGIGVGSAYAVAKQAYPGAVYQDVARLVAREGSISTTFTFTQEQGGTVLSYLVGPQNISPKLSTCE